MGRGGVAEVGVEAELLFDAAMAGKLGAPFDCPPAAGAQDRIVEGDRAPQPGRHGIEHVDERVGDGIGLEAALRQGDGDP
jgi:hypothetical protein